MKSLEFNSCFITWDTIKRVISDASDLRHFSLAQCKFHDQHRAQSSAVLGEFSEFRVGETVSKLQSLKIQETEKLRTVNRILEKLLGFSTRSLEKVWISFDPSSSKEDSYEDNDLDKFCELMSELVEMNTSTLRSLHLDIKCQPLLNLILPNLFGKLQRIWSELKLQEFLLSPPGCTPTPRTVDITENSIKSAEILANFLASQGTLKKVAIPHVKRMDNGQEAKYRNKISSRFPSSIEFLCIPNQEYLPVDFLHSLPNLKKLFIGGSTSDDGRPIPLKAELFNVTVTEEPESQDTVKQRVPELDKLTELGIGSSIVNGLELMKLVKKLHFVCKLEVTSQLPVIQDEDLQCCIDNMPLLQKLTISSCDFLTDFGITGILRNTCEMMVRLNNYYNLGDSVLHGSGNSGKALSQLKGA
jgi:hypothetical protein